MAQRQQYPDKYVLTGKEDLAEIASFIKDKVRIYDEQNNVTYRQWLLNTAFARGQQWGGISTESNVFVALCPPAGLSYVTDDMISPWKRAMVANLSIGRPRWEAVPKSIAPDAIMSSRTAQDILDAFWDEWRFIEKDLEGNEYLIDFNNFLVFIRYNEDEAAGEIITDSETGEVIYSNDGSPVKARVKVGKVSADIRPPHHLGCPLDPRDLDEKEWIFWRQSRPLGYFRDKYKKLGEKITPDSEHRSHESELAGISRGRSGGAKQDMAANEFIFMQKPNDTTPDGLVIPIAGSTILEEDRDKWRWQFDTMVGYPVVHIHGVRSAGEFWARSSIEQQIPLQKALNRVVSSMVDNVDAMAHMKWGLPETADVADIWDDNEVIVYTGNQPPAMLKVESLPQWLTEERQALKAAIRDIQSWHGTSQGGAVSGVRSDLHAQNLQDQDMLPWTTSDNMKASGWARIGEKLLKIYAEKMPEQPMSFVRDGRPIVVQNFNSTMLENIARINVKMVGTNMRNRAATEANIVSWYQAGLITDPLTGQPDALQVTKLLEHALPQSQFDEYRVHSNQAYLENIKLYNGEAPKPYNFENHFIHLKTHREELNSPRFRQLLEAAEAGDPDATKVTSLFMGHIEATTKIQQQLYSQLAPPAEQSKSGGGKQSNETSQQGEPSTNR